MICAGFAIVATVIYIVLGFKGVKTLQDIRERQFFPSRRRAFAFHFVKDFS